jgi:TolA-binding protein
MRRSFALKLIFAVMLPLAAHAQPVVQSQEGIALENQILQLQQQVQQLQASSGGGGSALGGAGAPAPAQQSAPAAAAPDPSVVTNLLTQVGQLQSQVQQLNGEVDTLQNQVNTQNAQTQKAISDLKFQMGNGAASAGAPPASAGAAPPGTTPTPPAAYIAPPAAKHESPPPATHAEAAPPAHATPHTLLHDAEQAYYKRDYSLAEADAHTILNDHGTSPEAYKAQFLLAEALAGDGRAQDAAIAYDDAYNRDRSGSEAAPSLLGLANALADINQKEAACDTLSSLNSQFPKPPGGLGPRIAAVSQKAHCS